MEAYAVSSSLPMAFNTYDGSNDAEVQAEPDDTATLSLRAPNIVGTDKPVKEILRVLGKRCSVQPFIMVPGMCFSPSSSWFRSKVYLTASAGCSSLASA